MSEKEGKVKAGRDVKEEKYGIIIVNNNDSDNDNDNDNDNNI